jgi:uncharacterized membrane protein YciS (DUF1049 family)
MYFLTILFWILVTAAVVLFGARNWSDVTLNLWGDIQADIKIPLLLLFAFLLGFLPTWLVMRTRLWTTRRRLEALERQAAVAVEPRPILEDAGPSIRSPTSSPSTPTTFTGRRP